MIGRDHANRVLGECLLDRLLGCFVEVRRASNGVEHGHAATVHECAQDGGLGLVQFDRAAAVEEEDRRLLGVAMETREGNGLAGVGQTEPAAGLVQELLEVAGALVPVRDLGLGAVLVRVVGGLAPGYLSDQLRGTRLPFPLGPSQRRGGQGKRRKAFAAGNALRGCLGRIAEGHEPVVLAFGHSGTRQRRGYQKGHETFHHTTPINVNVTAFIV